jgi:hypothetical protein
MATRQGKMATRQRMMAMRAGDNDDKAMRQGIMASDGAEVDVR